MPAGPGRRPRLCELDASTSLWTQPLVALRGSPWPITWLQPSLPEHQQQTSLEPRTPLEPQSRLADETSERSEVMRKTHRLHWAGTTIAALLVLAGHVSAEASAAEDSKADRSLVSGHADERCYAELAAC